MDINGERFMNIQLMGNRNFKHQKGIKRPLEVRFWEKVEATYADKCWNWAGHLGKFNYGQIQVNGRPEPAHRVSWELRFGTIPDGMCVLHRCDNPSCVNPHHLFLGTNLDNIKDRHAKNRDARGERSGKSTLTNDQVIQIKRLYRPKVFGCRKIGKQLGIDHSTVCHVISGRTWK